ncbi:response regulator [Mangrovihabitans endophyticus]|nr:response regulator [Mangrovihabitans endophyticus]
MSAAGDHATVLLVDDEESVLLTLTLQLRKDFRVVTAVDGPSALSALSTHAPVAAVVCDRWMPGTDGIELLRRIRDDHPWTTRILHTGRADLETARAAINTGQIFRFVDKPVSTDELRRTVRDAVEQHRVQMAERDLLDKTLGGSITALFGCLEMASPAAFARAARIRTLVGALCRQLNLTERWQIEVAAMASQLGAVMLPPDVVDKLDHGVPLADDEQRMVDAVPGAAVRLLRDVPLLDEVVQIIRALEPGFRASAGTDDPPVVRRGAAVLRLALRYETLHARAYEPDSIIASLRSEGHHPEIVAAACRVGGLAPDRHVVRALNVGELSIGMEIVEDVRAPNGLVLVGRGMAITELLIERLMNFRDKGMLAEPVLAAVPGTPDPAAGDGIGEALAPGWTHWLPTGTEPTVPAGRH